jgi:hypothetical protein
LLEKITNKNKLLQNVVGVIVFVIAVYVLDAILFTLIETSGLIEFARQALSLKGHAPMVCMYLSTLLSILLVTLIYGCLFWFNHKTVKAGAVLFIIADILQNIIRNIHTWSMRSRISSEYVSEQAIQQGIVNNMISTILSRIAILVIALICIRSLYSLGGRLRNKKPS